MFRWHHRLNEHEFEQTQGNSDGQGSLTCCSPWGCKELNMIERLNNFILGKSGHKNIHKNFSRLFSSICIS